MKRLLDDNLLLFTVKAVVISLSKVTNSNNLGLVTIFCRESDPKLIWEISEQIVELISVEVPPNG